MEYPLERVVTEERARGEALEAEKALIPDSGCWVYPRGWEGSDSWFWVLVIPTYPVCENLSSSLLMICECSIYWFHLNLPKVFFSKKVNFTLRKQEDSDTCYNVDESWGHHTKWNKPRHQRIKTMIVLMWSFHICQIQRQKVERWAGSGGGGQRVSV